MTAGALRAGLCLLVVAGAALGVRRGLHHEVYDAFFFPIVADRVTEEATSPADAAWRLHEFVYLNLRAPSGASAPDGDPRNVLLRGFAFCDHAVLVFLRLLETREISGRMVYLRRADGVSPHTVSEVLLGGGWRVFDTFYGFAPRWPDGRLASVRDVVAQPGLLGPSRTPVEWYEHAEIQAVLGPAGDQDRDVSLIARRGGRLAVRALLALAPRWLEDRLQDAYLALPPRPVPDDRFVGDPDVGRLFVKARHYQLFQRTADARAAYREILRRYPVGGHVDDVLYELGLLELTEAHDPTAALADLDRMLERDPASPWRGEAAYLRARAYEAMGRCGDAAQLYRQLTQGFANGLEDARTRLSRLHCT